jgi:hypothetical protein
MTREFDPKRGYLAIKAHEKMLAFVGFNIRLGENDSLKEGVIKISSFRRPYGGGYLTLTFIIDTEGDEALKDQLTAVFEKLTDQSIRPKLGEYFERIAKVSLDSLADTREWYIEEVNIYFRSWEERETVVVGEKIIPALESVLPCSFDTLQWWPENQTPRTPTHKEIQAPGSLKALFKNWFESA